MLRAILFAQEGVMKAASNEWANSFFGLDEDQRFVLLIVGISCVTTVVILVTITIANVYCSITRRRAETELKQDMLDRGMSAEEISEVIKAASVQDPASRWVEAWAEKKKPH